MFGIVKFKPTIHDRYATVIVTWFSRPFLIDSNKLERYYYAGYDADIRMQETIAIKNITLVCGKKFRREEGIPIRLPDLLRLRF